MTTQTILSSVVHLCPGGTNWENYCKARMVKRVHSIPNINTLEKGARICPPCLKVANITRTQLRRLRKS